MDVDEARALLEVEAGVPADVLRRAYLRAVRRHPAERDPEGFRRVRTAYELLQDFAVHAPLFEPSPSAGSGSAAPAPVVVVQLPRSDESLPGPAERAVEAPAQAVLDALRARHPVKAARLFQERAEALTRVGAFAVRLGDDVALALLAAGKTRSARAHVTVVDRLIAHAGLAGHVGVGHDGLVHAAIRDLVALSDVLPDHEIAALTNVVIGQVDPKLELTPRVQKALETTPALAALLPPQPAPGPPAETGERSRWPWLLAPALAMLLRLCSSSEPRQAAPTPVIAQPIPPTMPPNASPQTATPAAPGSTLGELAPGAPGWAPLGLPNLPMEPESFVSVGRALAKEGLNLQHATLYTLGMDLRQAKDCAAATKTRAAIARELATHPGTVAAATAAIAFVDRTCGTAHP